MSQVERLATENRVLRRDQRPGKRDEVLLLAASPLTACYLVLTARSLLLTAYSVLLTTCCSLLTTYDLRLAAHCLLPTTY